MDEIMIKPNLAYWLFITSVSDQLAKSVKRANLFQKCWTTGSLSGDSTKPSLPLRLQALRRAGSCAQVFTLLC